MRRSSTATLSAPAAIVVHEDVAYLSAEGSVAVNPASVETRLALWTRYKGGDVARTTVTPEATAKMVALILRLERWIEVRASFLDPLIEAQMPLSALTAHGDRTRGHDR